MKVALVSPFDPLVPGGVNEHLRGLGEGLRGNGHDVVTITAKSTQPDDAQSGTFRIGRPINIPVNGSRASISLDITRYREISRLLQREGVDIVHVHDPFAPVLSPLALFASKVANVGTFHALHENYPLYRWGRPYFRSILGRLDRRIVVSDPVREELRHQFGGEYEVIPNGIDLRRFGSHVEPFEWASDGVPRVLFIGRFNEPRKGFGVLRRAMARVREVSPTVRLVVVGPGTPAASDEADWIDFVGRASDDDLPRYYRSCIVYCAPSLGNESFGIVLLEAMASGVAPVASANPGYSRVVTDGVDGLLTAPGDEVALASALIATLTEPVTRERLGGQALLTARQYEWHIVARRVEQVYEAAREAHLIRSSVG